LMSSFLQFVAIIVRYSLCCVLHTPLHKSCKDSNRILGTHHILIATWAYTFTSLVQQSEKQKKT